MLRGEIPKAGVALEGVALIVDFTSQRPICLKECRSFDNRRSDVWGAPAWVHQSIRLGFLLRYPTTSSRSQEVCDEVHPSFFLGRDSAERSFEFVQNEKEQFREWKRGI